MVIKIQKDYDSVGVSLILGGQGLGIALVAAQKAQIPVTLVDNSQASIDKGLKFAGPPFENTLTVESQLTMLQQINC